MRFLCLHGMGMNARIFKVHMDRIISALGSEHTFVFVNGPVPSDIAPGLKDSNTEGEEKYYRYFPGNDNLASITAILQNLINTVRRKGPFDGVIAFSEGGLAAATLIIKEEMPGSTFRSGFKCAIFFNALTPLDWEHALQVGSNARTLHGSTDGVLIDLPTAHIWSKVGHYYPGMGEDLVGLCDPSMREEVVHNLGHIVPGAVGDESLKECLRAIERTIERAKCM